MTSSTAHSATSILDLNDDCLRDVLSYLVVRDLCVVADVCARFRMTAIAHFAHSKPNVDKCVTCLEMANHHLQLQTSRILRNFASAMTTIRIAGEFWDFEIRRNPYCDQTRLMRLVSFHWSENIKTLQLIEIIITDEIACIIRQMLLRLENLSVENCTCQDEHLEKLLLEAPKLKELKLSSCSQRTPIVNQKFRNLESISLDNWTA